MFSLATKATPPKAYRVLAIAKLRENDARKGFLSDDQFHRLAAACSQEGTWLRAMLEVGYTFGWRVSEVKRLRVNQVDVSGNRIFLDPGSTKNGHGRVVKFKPGSVLADLLQQCCVGKRDDDFVFTREDGSEVKDFRGAWAEGCRIAGVGHKECKVCKATVDDGQFCPVCKVRRRFKELRAVGLLFHDLRRSAARNARASGVPEGIVMKLGGWKTREVFDRYAIIEESDMEQAIDLIEARRLQVGMRGGDPW
jgi:integrase